MGQTPAIEAEGLIKNYGTTKALAGFDLAVPAGTVYGLLGPGTTLESVSYQVQGVEFYQLGQGGAEPTARGVLGQHAAVRGAGGAGLRAVFVARNPEAARRSSIPTRSARVSRRRPRRNRAGLESDRESGAEHFGQRPTAGRGIGKHLQEYAGGARNIVPDRGRLDGDVNIHREARRPFGAAAKVGCRLPFAGFRRRHDHGGRSSGGASAGVRDTPDVRSGLPEQFRKTA